MEYAIANAPGPGWRHTYSGWGGGILKETTQTGAFINGVNAAKALVECVNQGM
jgi:hypothetical protein